MKLVPIEEALSVSAPHQDMDVTFLIKAFAQEEL